MLELTVTPEDIEKAKSERTGWWNPDGSFNVEKMQADIKQELIKGQQKQRPARRHNRRKNTIPPQPEVETPRPNPIIERIKQVQL